MTTPEGLHRGPGVDGRPTWYGLGHHVPEGWEARQYESDRWTQSIALAAVVQCRPVELPDPKWLTVEAFPDGHWLAIPATWVTADGHTAGVTTVGEMRDRSDLDRWEIADEGEGRWESWPVRHFRQEHIPADFPVIVRRRS